MQAVELVHHVIEVLRPLEVHDHCQLRCEIETFVPVAAVTKQRVVPSKVSSTAEGDFRPDEKETEDTVLELLKMPSSSATAGCNPEQSAEAQGIDTLAS